MATMVAPPAIEGLFAQVKKLIPAAVNLGITGDARHVADGGYHISRSLLLANGMSHDYSIQHANDKLGDPDNSSAIDIGFGGYGVPEVKLVSQRLLAAGKNNDPRIAPYCREFYGCGPSDRSNDVIGWDYQAHQSATTDDLSHRGHIHLSIVREFSNDPAALSGIAAVMAGQPLEVPLSAAEVAQIEAAILASEKRIEAMLTKGSILRDWVGRSWGLETFLAGAYGPDMPYVPMVKRYPPKTPSAS